MLFALLKVLNISIVGSTRNARQTERTRQAPIERRVSVVLPQGVAVSCRTRGGRDLVAHYAPENAEQIEGPVAIPSHVEVELVPDVAIGKSVVKRRLLISNDLSVNGSRSFESSSYLSIDIVQFKLIVAAHPLSHSRGEAVVERLAYRAGNKNVAQRRKQSVRAKFRKRVK